ncbi:GlcG/HbpS family heme-binding protein [Oceanimonas doudoroffii]|uniref:GlcG protein n=1 Tax=Oceanimonas doudoroffii TaxID=84158 RepID=A0A233RK06_9GAMM|nr:heme-binding protein [Oceanimonas doudoroffii]OXY83714.1 GlcG protein [Oceanimonas doudoroffii]
MNTVSLEQALVIIQGALNRAKEVSAAPLTVAVLDNAGVLVALQRQDNSSLMRPDIAIAKAWGSIALGRSSRGLAEMAAARPGFMQSLNTLGEGKILPAPGGVLIRDENKRIIGAVGITGDLSDVDEACAVAGVEHAGLQADCS